MTALLALSHSAAGQERGSLDMDLYREKLDRAYEIRPRRIDEPLRAANIGDEEVREVEAIASERYPGALVNISGVTDGCPCEEGPSCDSQV